MIFRLLIILSLALLSGCHRGGDIDNTTPPIEFSFAEGCNTEPLFTNKGGEADIERASGIVMDDYRAGKIGRITLEKVEKEALKENAEKADGSEEATKEEV